MSFKDKIAKIKETTSPTLDKAKTKINEASDYVGGKSEQAKKAIVAASEKVDEAKEAVVKKAEEISPEGVEKVRGASEIVKDKTAEMNLLNSTIKKEAMEDLKKANDVYEQAYLNTVDLTVKYHESKVEASGLLKDIEEYINSIANSPKEIVKTVSEISVNRQAFDSLIYELEIETDKAVKISGGTAGAGILAGAGVAAFGPTALMAIATTFGTASTGVAISSLTGAAATNAALAWLGGGALATGGAGMAGGNAFLALAGPVGWTIGGVALVGSGIFLNHKNKKAAADAEEARIGIENETVKLEKIKSEVNLAQVQLDDHRNGLSILLSSLSSTNITDYNKFSTEQKYNLGSLVNNAKALSEYIRKGLSTDE